MFAQRTNSSREVSVHTCKLLQVLGRLEFEETLSQRSSMQILPKLYPDTTAALVRAALVKAALVRAALV